MKHAPHDTRIRPIELSAQDVAIILRVIARLPGALYFRHRLTLPDLVRRHYLSADDRDRRVRPDRVVQLARGLLRRLRLKDFCVPQSLIVLSILTRYGVPASIVFGVAKKGDDLHGHAWVELYGQPLGEASDPRQNFSVTYAYPEQERG